MAREKNKIKPQLFSETGKPIYKANEHVRQFVTSQNTKWMFITIFLTCIMAYYSFHQALKIIDKHIDPLSNEYITSHKTQHRTLLENNDTNAAKIEEELNDNERHSEAQGKTQLDALMEEKLIKDTQEWRSKTKERLDNLQKLQ